MRDGKRKYYYIRRLKEGEPQTMTQYERVYQAESELIDLLGYEDLYNQLSKALGTDELETNLAYNARMNYIKLSVDIKE